MSEYTLRYAWWKFLDRKYTASILCIPRAKFWKMPLHKDYVIVGCKSRPRIDFSDPGKIWINTEGWRGYIMYANGSALYKYLATKIELASLRCFSGKPHFMDYLIKWLARGPLRRVVDSWGIE